MEKVQKKWIILAYTLLTVWIEFLPREKNHGEKNSEHKLVSVKWKTEIKCVVSTL